MLSGIGIAVLSVLAIGIIGIFLLSNANDHYRAHIEAIDLARQAQLELDKQYYTWKKIMLEGNDFSVYKSQYHEFSYHMVHVSDLLFNLKLMLLEKTIGKDISELRTLHFSLSKEYTHVLLNLEKAGFQEKKKSINIFREKETMLLAKMNRIVERIRDESSRDIGDLIEFYLRLIAVSIALLTFSVIVMGFFIGKVVIRSQEYLEKKIARRTRDIQHANQMLAQSEKRYRRIIEGTGDIIFTLNSDLIISAANPAIKRFFRIKPENLIGVKFAELIYEGSDGRGMSKKIILDKINDFIRDKTPVNFIADFKSPAILEPKTLYIQLEHIGDGDAIEILGKGTPVMDTHLTRFLVYERLCLFSENYLGDAEEISFRLTNQLTKYLDNNEITLIRIGLREMIINAIEHGNLEITYEEKTRALEENNYFELLSKRRTDARYIKRKVRIDSIISADRAVFRITDDGNGFDTSTYLNMKELEAPHIDSHGRGILMARQVFDEIRYNSKGNQVLLIRYLKKSAVQEISGKGLSHCQPVLPI